MTSTATNYSLIDILRLLIIITRSHAIAKMTARCTQYMSALKIVCKRKINRRLRKNLHITVLSLFGSDGEYFKIHVFKIIFLQRVSIACYAERCISYSKSVRLSVRLSVCHRLAL